MYIGFTKHNIVTLPVFSWACESMEGEAMDGHAVMAALRRGNRDSGGRGDLFAEAKDPRKWEEIRRGAYYRDMIDDVRSEAARLLHEPTPVLTYAAYKQFDTTGSRTAYQTLYFARRRRLNAFAFMALLDGDDAYADALADAVWAVCDEYTWCLPAHLGGKSLDADAESGHRCAIDLFAAETAFTLAEIVELLGERLDGVVKTRVKREIRERVLEPYNARGSSFFWETAEMNWASVCGGAIGAAALYLITDDSELAPIVQRLLGTMDCYLRGFKNDGVCTEGSQYWSYGFGYFLYFAELLKQRTAGALDLAASEKVRQIALFHQKSFLTGRYAVPFSDTEPEAGYSVGLIHALKRRFADVHVPEMKHRLLPQDDPVGRWAPFIRDFVWSDSGWTGADWEDGVMYMPDAQWLVCRLTSGGVRYAFAAKGGHNGEPHNHNDLGSFVFHADGETILADIGAGEYTKAYFGEPRYTFLPCSSRGHSVPIVEGLEQQDGEAHRAKVVQAADEEAEARFSIELAAAYDNANLQSLLRTFTIDKASPHILKLEDRFIMRDVPSSIVERFITCGKPEKSEDGVIRIRGARRGGWLFYDGSRLRVDIRLLDYVDKYSKPAQVYAIDLEVVRPSATETVHLRFEIDKEEGG